MKYMLIFNKCSLFSPLMTISLSKDEPMAIKYNIYTEISKTDKIYLEDKYDKHKGRCA